MIYSIKRFGKLEDFDNRSTNLHTELNEKFGKFRKGSIDKVGLGNTKFGRALKRNIDNEINYRNTRLRNDLEFRSDIYGYKKK